MASSILVSKGLGRESIITVALQTVLYRSCGITRPWLVSLPLGLKMGVVRVFTRTDVM